MHCGNDIFAIIDYLWLRVFVMHISTDGIFLPEMRDPSLKINGVIGVKNGHERDVPLLGHEVGHYICDQGAMKRYTDFSSITNISSETIIDVFEIEANYAGADLTINTERFAELIGYQSYSRQRYMKEKAHLESILRDYQELVNTLRFGRCSSSQRQRFREYEREIPHLQEHLLEVEEEFSRAGYLTTPHDLAEALDTTEAFVICKHRVMRECRGYKDLPRQKVLC